LPTLLNSKWSSIHTYILLASASAIVGHNTNVLESVYIFMNQVLTFIPSYVLVSKSKMPNDKISTSILYTRKCWHRQWIYSNLTNMILHTWLSPNAWDGHLTPARGLPGGGRVKWVFFDILSFGIGAFFSAGAMKRPSVVTFFGNSLLSSSHKGTPFKGVHLGMWSRARAITWCHLLTRPTISQTDWKKFPKWQTEWRRRH
jgi:hypothetical protein